MEEIKCITILRSGYLLKKVRSSPEKKGDQPTFFFQYGQNYNPEKKYAVPLRTIIGKAHPSDNTLMYPNEKYQEYFPDAVLPEELPEAYRSCCLRIGAYAIICYVLNEYKLSQLLARWFPKDNGLLMDLVAYLIVNEDNAGQYYPDFAFCHPLFSDGMRIYSDSKVCRFLKSVPEKDAEGKNADLLRVDDYENVFRNKAGDRELTIHLQWTEKKKLSYLVLKEAIPFSQRVEKFSVWYAAEDGRKEKMVDATTIGYKKIIDLQGVETDAIEIRIEDSRVAPVISFVGVY